MRLHTSFWTTAAASYVPAASSNERRTRRFSSASGSLIEERLDRRCDALDIGQERRVSGPGDDFEASVRKAPGEMRPCRARHECIVLAMDDQSGLVQRGQLGAQVVLRK